jgi:hypothetical protein
MMFLCQNVDFRFSYKKQWFFNSFEQPTSRRAPNFKARAQLQGARPRAPTRAQLQGARGAATHPQQKHIFSMKY